VITAEGLLKHLILLSISRHSPFTCAANTVSSIKNVRTHRGLCVTSGIVHYRCLYGVFSNYVVKDITKNVRNSRNCNEY